MNICGRGGHTEASCGAIGYLNELKEDRPLYKRVIELLREVGNNVTDVTPPEGYSYPSELNYGINKANSMACDLFFSIHFNSGSNDPNGGEVIIYPGTVLTSQLGNRIVHNLSNAGFVHRGVKTSTSLGEIVNVNAPSMIIEVCFVQDSDGKFYKSLEFERIARAIANGIDNRVSWEVPEEVPFYRNVIVYMDNAVADMYSAYFFSYILNNAKEDCHVMSLTEYKEGGFKAGSLFAIGGQLEGKIPYNKIFAGAGRNESAQAMHKHLKSKNY